MTGLILLAGILWSLSLLLTATVTVLLAKHLYKKHIGIIEIRRQRLGP